MFIGATLVRRSMTMSRNPEEKCEEMCSTDTRESETWRGGGDLQSKDLEHLWKRSFGVKKGE